ncbi:hypothetical protein ACJ41O_014488 [Fusarium nematophilum]
MTTSGSVFSDTLQEITDTKLDELSKRRSRFEEAKSSALASIQVEKDPVQRLITLGNGVKQCFAIKLDKAGKVVTGQTKHKGLEIELKNLDRFLGQAKYDPSVSATTMNAWEQSLLRHLDTQSLKFQYASLYGKLVTEWLSEGDDNADSDGGDVEMGEAFEVVGDAKKLESRMKWEKMVFEPSNIDEAALKQYLDRLFGVGNKDKEPVFRELRHLRESVEYWEAQMSTPDQFDVSTLKWVIRGLHSSDLLSDEKREVLKDFESNSIILNEIADVLNMRISALGSWTWSSEAVPVEMRRKISGIYNIHMHQDLLQAIFLQYIGVEWSTFFKRQFKRFRLASCAWKAMRRTVPEIDKRRLEYYLGEVSRSPSLQSARRQVYSTRYFMAQLLNYEEQAMEVAQGEEEADYACEQPPSLKRKAVSSIGQYSPDQPRGPGKGLGRGGVMRHRKIPRYSPDDSVDDDYNDLDEVNKTRNPMELKQTLLHMLSTEITIGTRLYGEMTAFHSVFESWDSLLPRETVCTILKYFGFSETWLGFFKSFLEAPLKFVEDDNSTAARKRRRGTPSSHVLSDVFAETTLFCLDFAINQSTDGAALWRIHDDFWFWSHEHNVAVDAWKIVQEFSRVTGTKTNPVKTGSVRASGDENLTLPLDKSLPAGEIRWGFLQLSPQMGRFEIDQTMVDSHIEELRKQLHDKRKSILGFIQAWNSFASTFFTSNFGKAANCFGRQHVDNMLATHERIQRQVFSTLPGDGDEKVSSVAEYLKKALSDRFDISDVPDGYLYLPMELGGLDLQSPFISLLQIHDEVLESSSELMDKFQEAERKAYQRAKEDFLAGRVKPKRYRVNEPIWEPESERDRETFMSFEEYVRYREDFASHGPMDGPGLGGVFRQLMKQPAEKSVEPDSSKVWTALKELRGKPNMRSITGHWDGMEPYWRWVAMMYGPEVVDRFGGLNVVDAGLLPVGMVALFRDKRVRW